MQNLCFYFSFPLSSINTYIVSSFHIFFSNSFYGYKIMTQFCGADSRGTIWGAVSYTHLDVYKRQRHDIRGAERLYRWPWLAH